MSIVKLEGIAELHSRTIDDPPLSRFLFADTWLMIWVWLGLRLWIGLEWLQAAIFKIDNPLWVENGVALKHLWNYALQAPMATPPSLVNDGTMQTLQWMLNHEWYVWLAPTLVYTELLLGLALCFGAFVGITAFVGAVLNWSFIMLGFGHLNALLLVGSILLMLAWKTAGYIGMDFFLLRWLGVPWRNREEA